MGSRESIWVHLFAAGGLPFEFVPGGAANLPTHSWRIMSQSECVQEYRLVRLDVANPCLPDSEAASGRFTHLPRGER